MNEADTYDRTPQGQQVVALLRKHAPPRVDSTAAAQRVMARVNATRPAGRLVALRWLAAAASVAAVVVIAVVLTQPRETLPADEPVADKPASLPTATENRRDHAWPEIVAFVRRDGVIDAGLKDGLRVGDTLEGPGGAEARVTAVGVFEARIAAAAPFSRGTRLIARVTTEAQKRAARYAEFGGDPGAFFEFGVLVSALSLAEARLLGISDGHALRVEESLGSILRGEGQPQPTLASRLDLRAGDVILEVNGATVRTANDFAQALGWSLDPQRLSIRILRNGKQLDLKL